MTSFDLREHGRADSLAKITTYRESDHNPLTPGLQQRSIN